MGARLHEKLGPELKRKPKPGPKRCLRCQRTFQPAHKDNWICRHCTLTTRNVTSGQIEEGDLRLPEGP